MLKPQLLALLLLLFIPIQQLAAHSSILPHSETSSTLAHFIEHAIIALLVLAVVGLGIWGIKRFLRSRG